MGWASGSGLAEGVWKCVRRYVPKENRPTVAKAIVDLFEGEDCDTMDEATTLMRDAGYDN